MSQSLQARYFDGKSPVEQQIEVETALEGLRLYRAGEIVVTWPRSRLQITRFLGELRCSIGEDAYLLLPLHAGWPDGRALAQETPRVHVRRGWALGLLLGTLIAMFGLFKFLPIASYTLARQIPIEAERRIFDTFLPLKALEEDTCQDPKVRELMERVRTQYLDQTDIEILLLDWQSPNAFAFPGGRMAVTQGLLDILEQPEEMIAVMAHELGHIELRHNLGEFIRTTSAAFFWTVLVGDFSGAFVVDPSLLRDVSELGYSREAEFAADRFAAEHLLLQQLDPKALGKALQRIEIDQAKKEEELDDRLQTILKYWKRWLTTHPETQERVKALEGYAPGSRVSPLSVEEWQYLRRACVGLADKPQSSESGEVDPITQST
ncbi:MAG: M48 family metallopeptidase [Oligoflexus sp.]|jgi:Zn-dependent protease with chaperone function